MAFRDVFLCVVVAGLTVYQPATSQMDDCDEFHLRPENVVARAGDMATMSCLYDEDGVMIITWDKDTTSIIPGTTCDCSIVGNGNLKFNNVSLGDVAEYTCNVMTDFGSRKACSALLGLAEAPGISDPGPLVEVKEPMATLSLSALVTGDPSPTTQWSHRNQVLSPNGSVSITSEAEGEGQRVRLTINNIAKEDRGVYRLHATNRAGEAQQEWTVPVVFAEVNPIQKRTTTDSRVELTCTGQYYTTGEERIEWNYEGIAGGDVSNMLDKDGYEFSFTSIVTVDPNTCQGTEESVSCTLHLEVESQQAERIITSICGGCSPPTLEPAVQGCTGLTVRLSGSPDSYMVGYKAEGAVEWMDVEVTLNTSSQVFSIADLQEATTYTVRVTCSPSGPSPSLQTITSSSKPSAVVAVSTEAIYNSSGTFSSLQWQESSSQDVVEYHITWQSDQSSVTHQLSVPATSTQYDWAIECDVTYTYRVAAINPCGMGPLSSPVEQLCHTVPPAQRVALEMPTSAASSSGAALLLTFTINHIDLVKSVRVDVEEQDNNFVALQTLNYSLSEDSYQEGSVCVGSLTEGAHYLVCLRVDYSDIGEDASCSRLSPVEEEVQQVSHQCQLPTSSRRVTEAGTTSDSAIPDWGIAVIVVGALLLVALIFCFLGLCFACQTSKSNNVNFGSSSSINTERGGNVVPTAMHMHNPRTMSPTRSCLKYHRERGHTWNDHVDTLRQMETDKGTHV